MPYKNLLAVSLLQRLPSGTHCVEVVLIQRHANQRRIDSLHDGISIFKAVDGHIRCTAELQAQLDAVRLYLLHHFLQNGNGILTDFLARRLQAACLHVLRRNDNNHFAAQNVAAADDFVQFVHHCLLFLCRLLHIEEAQRIVRQHLQMMRCEPCTQLFDGHDAFFQIAVQALGLDVDAVKAVLLAKLQILHHGVSLTKTVVCLIKTQSHLCNLLFLGFVVENTIPLLYICFNVFSELSFSRAKSRDLSQISR